MDVNSLLPFLMNRAGGGNGGNMDALLKMAQGEKPDISTVMDMAMKNQKKAAPVGLSPIIDVASYEILGKLIACFYAQSAAN